VPKRRPTSPTCHPERSEGSAFALSPRRVPLVAPASCRRFSSTPHLASRKRPDASPFSHHKLIHTSISILHHHLHRVPIPGAPPSFLEGGLFDFSPFDQFPFSNFQFQTSSANSTPTATTASTPSPISSSSPSTTPKKSAHPPRPTRLGSRELDPKMECLAPRLFRD
jgi:hypothetical protein